MTASRSAPVRARNSTAKAAASRKLSDLCSLGGGDQFITHAPHGLDDLGIEAGIELEAQAADVALDDAGMGIKMDLPYVFQEHPARDGHVRVPHEVLEQAELLGQQVNDPPLPR